MKNFDLHRFGQTFKSQLLMGRNFWLKLFAIFFLVLFFAELLFTEVGGVNYNGQENYGMAVDNATGFCTFFFVISMLFGATSIFSVLKDTRSRISYLMFPASNLEKYLNSLILSTVVVALVTFVAFFCADTVRTLMAPAFGHEMVWGVPSFISSLTPDTTYSISAPDTDKVYQWWLGTFMAVGTTLFFHSLYMLGGTAFRRQQFLITSMIIVCSMIIIVSILGHIDFKENINLMTYNEQDGLVVHPALYVIMVVMYLLTCFNYWLSYRIFCRVQAVNNKWLNV
ncbi:MAG: hypothetical protein IJV44_08480 [Prevotella sp.]|nr:hypothetical protein [Prevotella sp.]MBR1545489.1 hypothetical protein [Prevotella sp.]